MAQKPKVRQSRNSSGKGTQDPVFQNFKRITPLREKQEICIEAYREGMDLAITGTAGTGKTFIAINLAIESYLSGEVKKIRLLRSAVATRDQGFLPGTLEEKMAVFEAPYKTIFNKVLGRDDAYTILKTKGIVEFESTSYMRGDTWEDMAVIADEIENFSFKEINTTMTRRGKGCRFMILGDLVQTDLRESETGFTQMLKVFAKMRNRVEHVTMTTDDIVRDGFVKDWITQCERLNFK